MDEMAGWHHWLDGRESEWTPGVDDGQGGLACCDSWGHRELDTTERLNWTELMKVNVKVVHSYLTLCNLMDSTVHGILQARIQEWVAVPFSRGSSQPRRHPINVWMNELYDCASKLQPGGWHAQHKSSPPPVYNTTLAHSPIILRIKLNLLVSIFQKCVKLSFCIAGKIVTQGDDSLWPSVSSPAKWG